MFDVTKLQCYFYKTHIIFTSVFLFHSSELVQSANTNLQETFQNFAISSYLSFAVVAQIRSFA